VNLPGLSLRLRRNRITRRDLLWLFGAGVAASGLSGCATSPVTGERILVGMSEAQERQIDRRSRRTSSRRTWGRCRTTASTATSAASAPHARAHATAEMPYSYRVLNANYINAYTFPAARWGSRAAS
jgi:beta-barrel assembly-enhancing protease